MSGEEHMYSAMRLLLSALTNNTFGTIDNNGIIWDVIS